MLQYGVMVFTFVFSFVAFSLASQNKEGFISPVLFGAGFFTVLMIFFLLRIFDESKDAVEDKKYRPYRPVPRGLITLKELNICAWFVILIQFIIQLLVLPKMLFLYGLVLIYILLMRKEFFIPTYLRRHPLVYLFSHMLAMPLIAYYITALEWINSNQSPTIAIYILLVVSFLNGLVIEFGRKIRRPEAEETGVETYSAMWGTKRASNIWLLTLFLTAIFTLAACYFIGFAIQAAVLITPLLFICLWSVRRFYISKRNSAQLSLEKVAGVWTLGLYLIIGILSLIY